MLHPKELKKQREAEQKIQKEIRAKFVDQRRSVETDIRHSGIMSVRYKLEAIQNNPNLKPDNGLTLEETVIAYNEAIEKHLGK